MRITRQNNLNREIWNGDIRFTLWWKFEGAFYCPALKKIKIEIFDKINEIACIQNMIPIDDQVYKKAIDQEKK
jgi:hypothetical protein